MNNSAASSFLIRLKPTRQFETGAYTLHDCDLVHSRTTVSCGTGRDVRVTHYRVDLNLMFVIPQLSGTATTTEKKSCCKESRKEAEE